MDILLLSRIRVFKTGYLLNVTYSVKNGSLAANQTFFASAGIKIVDFQVAANPFAQYLFFSQF
jgi:hypothetical protein